MKLGIYGFSGDFRWLSNFWPVNINYDGRNWPTTEHAYQATKTLDSDWKEAVHGARTASCAKKLGRRLPVREDWEKIRLDVMRDLQRLKYQDGELAEKLLATGEVLIEETNAWGDTFWGVCKGQGENHLGKILMEVREELRHES
jgi:ribA/ribD-fused uncharacterized protein